MQIKDPNHKKIIEDRYPSTSVVWIIRTELRWKWGLPFPYLIALEDRLEIVAVKQSAAKVYAVIPYSNLHYTKVQDKTLILVTNEKEILIPVVEISQEKLVETHEWLNKR